MENATNGLLIAALVLIGVIICSIFVAVFSSTGNFAKDIEEKMQDTAIQKYNDQFERFFPNNEAKGEDIVSLIYLAKNINQKEGITVIDIKKGNSTNSPSWLTKSTTDLEKLVKDELTIYTIKYSKNREGKIETIYFN